MATFSKVAISPNRGETMRKPGADMVPARDWRALSHYLCGSVASELLAEFELLLREAPEPE